MHILISGGCKNGKSSLAQDLACEYAKKTGCRPIYFATMIPYDSEDEERIEKHRADRKDMGFITIECGKNLSETIKNMESGRVVLFDSLTALIANELFDQDNNLPEMDSASVLPNEKPVIPNLFLNPSLPEKIKSDLSALIEKSDSVIFVSDSIFSDGKIYDETIELYRKILAETENFIAQKCDKVVEMVAGNAECTMQNTQLPNGVNSDKNYALQIMNHALILGGSYQGKTAWAKRKFSLSDEDIFVCESDSMPDFSKKCLAHYENYVAYCLKNNLSPRTDFFDENASANNQKAKCPQIIICDDIFCGVVPIDAFQRKWREETGLCLQKIAEKAELWRIFCGRAERIS